MLNENFMVDDIAEKKGVCAMFIRLKITKKKNVKAGSKFPQIFLAFFFFSLICVHGKLQDMSEEIVRKWCHSIIKLAV